MALSPLREDVLLANRYWAGKGKKYWTCILGSLHNEHQTCIAHESCSSDFCLC